MNILNIIFYVCVFFLLNLNLVKSESVKASSFNNNFKCSVLGGGSVLSTGEKLVVKTYNKNFLNAKLSGTSQFNNFQMEACECYTNSGACRIALTSQEGSKNLRLILVLVLEDNKIVTNQVSFKTIFQDAEKKGKIQNRSYCDVKNSVYISSIYAYKNSSNKADKANLPGYDKAKDIVKSNHRFPLYYYASAKYGKIRDGKNGEEALLTIIGSYRVDTVVECVSKYADFSTGDRHEYHREGYGKNTAVACNWML